MPLSKRARPVLTVDDLTEQLDLDRDGIDSGLVPTRLQRAHLVDEPDNTARHRG
jgi:hypothetical protein